MIYADVIVDLSVKSLDRPFQYIVPQDLQEDVQIGTMVTIPFGKANRRLQGYIIGLSQTPKFALDKTKSIIDVVKQGVVAESHLLSLAYWMKENYGGTMNDAIKAVMPVRREIKEKVIRRILPLVSREQAISLREECFTKHQTAKVRALDSLLDLKEAGYEQGVDYDFAIKKYKLTASVLQGLAQKNIIAITSEQSYRNPYRDIITKPNTITLNKDQQQVVEHITSEYLQGKRDVYLLHGVTGSGKTQVYMDCIETVRKSGQQAIVMIPEIALTYQTVRRFYERFGDRVSVLHSRLSAGERFDQYTRAKNGEIDIMIGPRSALFTPFPDLGLLIMDEEHETSYQSEMPPKYHAREVAVQRAKMVGASVILGSATPSMESYYHAKNGEFQLLELKHRAANASLPRTSIVDLREEMKAKNYSVFSRSLADKIQERLAKKEQIMLFLNRRGYAGFVSCRSCGQVMGCPHCSVSLKPHLVKGTPESLVCHYCGHHTIMPKHCPKCGSPYIGTFGLGTEQVEQMVRKQFPEAKVLRMDADTTSNKGDHDRILETFSTGNADILIGTQMIVKGHDFPNVTLVGILAADLSLNVGDYRAAERTFQLLAQAAGRAGRAGKEGEVILQTYQPGHVSVVCAANHDYESFYQEEIAIRQMLQYPPVSNILGILVLSEKEDFVHRMANEFADEIKTKWEDQVSVLGPVQAPIGKLKDVFRMMIYVKSPDYPTLRKIKNEIEQKAFEDTWKAGRVLFEFNH